MFRKKMFSSIIRFLVTHMAKTYQNFDHKNCGDVISNDDKALIKDCSCYSF